MASTVCAMPKLELESAAVISSLRELFPSRYDRRWAPLVRCVFLSLVADSRGRQKLAMIVAITGQKGSSFALTCSVRAKTSAFVPF